ncbi:licheninase [Tepiditoga spiralis]|uniref:Licheninase n=1 Tax=Tepiditoga spiralis TaxID=2108365 RepID=A0A7G1G532_9BACT|nr:glycosyl hydrolase family 8 [Tepiditoga spiralis]BBE31668.1 licheninase [Tepiditoga spiralis]
MKKFFILIVLTMEMISLSIPFPNHTKYSENIIKPSIYTQNQLDDQVYKYYQKWKNRYLTKVSKKDQMYINWNYLKRDWVEPQNAVTVSEAHGYGMLIFSIIGDKDKQAHQIYDAMFNFFKAHPSSINPNLMAWQQINNNGKIVDTEDNDSAIDGDLDIALSLIIADKQWGSNGKINYKKEALNMINAIMESEVNHEDWILQLGDWAHNDKDYMYSTRSSDFILNTISTFIKYDDKNSKKWEKVYNKIIKISNFIFNNYSKETGLLPDFLVKNSNGDYIPSQSNFLEDENDGNYNWNACRDPWRLSLDIILGNKNNELYTQLQTMNTWIEKKTNLNPSKINPGYYLNGNKIIRDWEGTDISFVAPFAVSAMINKNNQKWLNKLWDFMLYDDETSFEDIEYFPNTIRMLVMLIISGNWPKL